MRSKRTLALVTAVAAVSAVLTAAPAFADDAATVGIGVARTVDDQRGTFRVTAWTDATGAALSKVTATLRDGDQTVATTPLVGAGDGVYTPEAVLKLTEDGGPLPHLGRYAIDVTAEDDQGHTVTRDNAGTLDFTLRPAFQNTGDQGRLGITRTADWDNRGQAVTDKLIGIEPGSGDTVPIEGRTVTVTRTYDSSMPDRKADATLSAATDAQGAFTTPDFALDWYGSYRAGFSADDSQVHGTADGYTYTELQRTTVYVTATADRTRAEPGQKVTVSGTVRTGTGTTGAPVAGAQVVLSGGSIGYGDRIGDVTVTTDATGHFTGAFTATPGSYNSAWYATLGGTFLSGEPVSGTLVVPQDSVYLAPRISLASDGRVTATARLVRTYDRVGAIYQDQTTHLEYSKDGKTGWKSIGSAKTTYETAKPSGWGYTTGYYRLHHPTSDELAQSYSSVVHLSRVSTRVEGNNAAPEPVKKGAKVTVTGTLKEYKSGWKALGGRSVRLYFQAKGSKTWTYITAGKTDSKGRAKLTGKAAKDGVWLLQYFGDSVHFDSYATADYVDVR
ncbi:hypothetical protein [Streptomyces beijiangensis]|uniref:Alpha-amylase n=1 Tax=Streptomyces beijiangensis TaxID=163361 RepID=A0A939JGR8_9ACTN|nr:hypothetical protein [Streptomyces beijiangensis]MBO0510784.1 hypothetical protein [Streptomyces beijiangensis]